MKLSDFIVNNAIVAELQAADRDSVIRELVTALATAKAIAPGDAETIIKAIIDREKHGSTGFGKGVAVPHVKHSAIKKRVGRHWPLDDWGRFRSAGSGSGVFGVFVVVAAG